MKYFILIASLAVATTAYFFSRVTPVPPEAKKMLTGPILYGISSGGVIYKIDPMTCESCPIFNPAGLSGIGIADLIVLPNGNILVQSSNGMRLYDPPNTNPIWSTNTFYDSSVLAPNGLVYLSSGLELSVFDPATNTVTLIGSWPPNVAIGEFFYQGGILYAIGAELGPPIVFMVFQVNLTDPSLTTIAVPNAPNWSSGGFTNGGYNTSIGANSNILWQYNVSTNTFTQVCTFAISGGINGLSDLPSGITEAPCLCLTDAGSVNNTAFNICVPGNVTVPYNNNATLDGNDILRYILFSNPNDTLGSIIVQSSSATIAYNSVNMQAGVTYYLATIAGNNQGGNVNLSDPCLDISNAATVVWRPRPAVVFTVPNPNVCAGECRTVTATFTGTPPFNLTYTTPAGTFTQVYASNTGTIQVCVPAGAAAGPLLVQATNLVDTWCGCQ